MKKIYSLLMAVLLTVLGSLGAVAATTAGSVKMTYVSGSDADVATSFGEVTTAYAGYNKISSGSVDLANKGWGVNNIAYLQVDASAASGPIKKVTLSGKFQQLAARGLWYGFGYNSSTWSSDLTWNTADRSITLIDGASVSCSKSAADLEASVDITAAFKEDADKIATILVYQTAAGGGYIKDASVEVEYVSQDEKMASYTLNYINGELTVKSESGELLVGETVPTVASFFVEDAKYFRAAGEPESFTIAEGENNFSVKVRPAETFNYSLLSSLGETLTSGSGLEGETVYVGYPRYQLSEGKFYEAGVTNKEYRKAIALTEDNVSATVDYAEWNGSNDVVFYAEGENIDGFTVSTAGNIPVRASNAKAGTATEDVEITALPAGKYKLHVGTFTSKTSEQKIYIGYGETQYAFASSGNLSETASEEVTFAEETAIKYFGTTSSGDAQFDYIWIEKTGDYVPPTPTYAVNIAEGIENGTVTADPVSALEGAEVTLTATPAEGYEFVSYSVTGVKSNEAVTVTDGKFNMPADDVTVSATFAKVYTVTISNEIENGTVVAEPTSAKAGDEVTLTATPAEGYEFVSYSVTGVKSNEAVTVTDGKFNMPADDVTVSATFQEIPSYSVIIAESIEGGTVVADPTSAKAGDEVTLTATPAEGYEFVSYSVTCKTLDEAVIVTDGKFKMPADDVTVSATFKKKPIYIETDLTADFDALTINTNWKNIDGGTAGYTATSFCPAVTTNAGKTVQVCEYYKASCDYTGEVLTQTVTGLTPGTYKIELYGGAAYTFGRGFDSEAFSEGTWNAGDKIEPSSEVSTGVTLYAETSNGTYGGELPIYYATNFPEGAAVVTIDGVQIGSNGQVKIGMTKTSKSTNWHVIQLKGVTAQVDARELHANAVAAAQAALSAEENAVIVGEEKTALETAIENNSKVAEETADAYKTAIAALQSATKTFTDARESYAALVSTKESVAGYVEKYVYASADKISAVNTAAEATPASAADATSKNESLTTALRAMAESHTKAEGVEGASIVEIITNPSAEDGTNGWTVVKGEGSGGSINVLNNEPWTSADGSTVHKYFDGGDWGASAWDVSLTQNVELAAGKYLLSAIGRASGDVALTLFAGENKAAMPAIGASDGLFNRGWNYTSVEFEVDTKSTVTIGVQGVTSVVHNWMSFSDFKLILLEAIPEYSITVAQPENGTVEVAPTLAKVGEEVTITATPAEGYELASISVTGVNTNEAVIVTDGKFKMPADDVTVSATFVLITGIDNASATANGTLPDGKYFIKGKLTIIKGGNKFGAAGVAK